MLGPSDIEAVVRGYRPAGDSASYDTAVAALSQERPMWPRTEFSPGHFTASGFVASPDRQSLLLIHHNKLKRWLQPGGHIESDDRTVESAARREIAEETGIADLVRVGSSLVRVDAHSIPAHGHEPAHIHLDLAIGFVATSSRIGPLDEVLEAEWVPFDDLADFGLDTAATAGARRLFEILS
ncbi:MAG: NUDIX domain-containing protein [Armatimonadetes bacterium]|nr:MAG: NUDIX domain-containing protein [Armatimonadota bacterium]